LSPPTPLKNSHVITGSTLQNLAVFVQFNLVKLLERVFKSTVITPLVFPIYNAKLLMVKTKYISFIMIPQRPIIMVKAYMRKINPYSEGLVDL